MKKNTMAIASAMPTRIPWEIVVAACFDKIGLIVDVGEREVGMGAGDRVELGGDGVRDLRHRVSRSLRG